MLPDPTHRVRVIAGSARGRRLESPRGTSVRPTSDRVREALFNALGSLDLVQGARVLDLFAGSGALGIEALSRGATHATFVDHDWDALRVVRTNLELTGLADRATVRRQDALGPGAADPSADLVLADPPYDFDEWPALLDGLGGAVVVMESDRPIEVPPDWEVLRERRYGGTVVTIARCTDRDDHGRPTPEDRS